MKIMALYFLLLLFSSCKESHKNSVPNQINFQQEIGKLTTGEISPEYRITQMLINKTDMTDINLGYDSLYIRVWYLYNLEAQVIDVFYRNNQWNANYNFINREPKDTVIKRTTTQILPKRGWKNFTKTFFNFGVTTLKSSTEIPGYEHNMDGSPMVVEISTRDKYRIYSYSSIGLNKDKDVAKNIIGIINLLKEEFRIEPIHEL